MLASGFSSATITERIGTIERLNRQGVDPVNASIDDLVVWLSELRGRDGGPPKPSTRQTYYVQLRAWFRWLFDAGHIGDDPSVRLPRVKVPRAVPRPLSHEQVLAVLGACNDPRSDWTRAYVTLGAFAGLRVHEIAKVRGQDVDLDTRKLRVQGKGGTDVLLPMGPRVYQLASTMPLRGWWFPSDTAQGHVDRKNVGLAISRAMQRARVNGTPHQLRHYFGTEALRAAGGNVRVAQEALRHQSIKSTAIYTQVDDGDLSAAIAAIGNSAAS